MSGDFDRLRGFMSYEDHRFLREGRHVEVARRLAARARHRLWRAFSILALYVGLGIWLLARPDAPSGTWLDAATAWALGFVVVFEILVVAMSWWFHRSVRELVRRVEALSSEVNRPPATVS